MNDTVIDADKLLNYYFLGIESHRYTIVSTLVVVISHEGDFGRLLRSGERRESEDCLHHLVLWLECVEFKDSERGIF
jgi:hypothetical protein